MAFAKAFHAYNLWLEDDWGYGYKGRLWSPPYIPMLDPELAADELEFVVGRGAKVVSIRPTPGAGRSQADPAFDRFWSIADEARTFVAYHAYGGRTVYDDDFKALYGRVPYSDKTYYATLAHALNTDRGIYETIISLVLGNLFGRFPNVRVGSIEMGMQWVAPALHAVDHAGGLTTRRISAFGTTISDLPSDVFKAHVYAVVHRFPEEDVIALTELIGVDRRAVRIRLAPPRGQRHPRRLRRVDCIKQARRGASDAQADHAQGTLLDLAHPHLRHRGQIGRLVAHAPAERRRRARIHRQLGTARRGVRDLVLAPASLGFVGSSDAARVR